MFFEDLNDSALIDLLTNLADLCIDLFEVVDIVTKIKKVISEDTAKVNKICSVTIIV